MKKYIGILTILISLLAYAVGTLNETPSKKVATHSVVVNLAQTKSIPDGFVTVVRVVDGDTIVVSINNKNETVRLIGINTPETVDPRKTVQCFGKEASAEAKKILDGQLVRLESDPTQSNRDKYERLLRYMYLSDGMSVNKTLIEEGYAYEYTYDIPYQFQNEYKKAERDARVNERGLWSPETCNGKLEN